MEGGTWEQKSSFVLAGVAQRLVRQPSKLRMTVRFRLPALR